MPTESLPSVDEFKKLCKTRNVSFTSAAEAQPILQTLTLFHSSDERQHALQAMKTLIKTCDTFITKNGKKHPKFTADMRKQLRDRLPEMIRIANNLIAPNQIKYALRLVRDGFTDMSKILAGRWDADTFGSIEKKDGIFSPQLKFLKFQAMDSMYISSGVKNFPALETEAAFFKFVAEKTGRMVPISLEIPKCLHAVQKDFLANKGHLSETGDKLLKRMQMCVDGIAGALKHVDAQAQHMS